jgi:hypothetical protein
MKKKEGKEYKEFLYLQYDEDFEEEFMMTSVLYSY